MKLIHTPLGTFVSKKKLLFGAAALALIGGISPAFINDSHAANYDDEDYIYTTVGPTYFTLAEDLYDYAQNNDNVYMYVEDTRVADFYDGYISNGRRSSKNSTLTEKTTKRDSEYYPVDSDVCEDNAYLCLQGKKVGETEIVVERNGSVVFTVPVKSVKLTPAAQKYAAIGDTVTGTGSLEGADDSLLRLRNALAMGNIAASITGERSYSFRATRSGEGALVWTIGNQLVGGGTFYYFEPLEVTDNVSHLEENEQILKDAFFEFYETLSEIDRADLISIIEQTGGVLEGFEYGDGNVVNFNILKGAYTSEPTASLELNLASKTLSNATKDALAKKMPKGASNLSYTGITAILTTCGTKWSEDSYGTYGVGSESGTMSCDENLEFVKIGKDITIILDVSDAEPVKSGLKRTWYVTREVNGEVELISDVTYNEKDKTITFASNSFGNYAYGYVDAKPAPAVPNTGAAPEKVAMVATATFAPLAAIAFGAFIARNRKKAANKLAKKHNHFE